MTNLDELTPYDMQVLNMAQLQRPQLVFTIGELHIPEFGQFVYIEPDRMQVNAATQKLSKWSRALSVHGGRALAKLHIELLSQPLDFGAIKADTAAREQEMREMLRSNISQRQVQVSHPNQNLLSQMGATLGVGVGATAAQHEAAVQAYRRANPPMIYDASGNPDAIGYLVGLDQAKK
jgi:hypothetical protein